jgi:hypothetical protein
MLKNYFYPTIQRKRLTNKIIFQQNRAPPHFSKQVRVWLNEKFDERWIGRGGPISWVPRSSDLTPLDFYLWGYVKTFDVLKTIVYKTTINDTDDLKNRIEREIKGIKKDTLNNVLNGIVKRLNFCIDVNGDTFELYICGTF